MRIVGNCEYAVLFYRDKLPKFNNNGKMVFNAMPWPREQVSKIHPTQKPVELFRWCIERVTKPGNTVIDPYMGSGPCGVACVQTGRNFIGIEIDPGYFEIAQQRIEAAQNEMIQAHF